MYIKRKALIRLQFKRGKAKKRLGSSVESCQVQKQIFWPAQQAWEKTSNASPLPNFVKMAKFDNFSPKIAKFFGVFTF